MKASRSWARGAGLGCVALLVLACGGMDGGSTAAESDAYGGWGADTVAEVSAPYGDTVASDGAGGWNPWDSPDSYAAYDAASDGSSGGWSPYEPGQGCVADCTGKQCGPDGCGGSCGWCPGTASCQAGTCATVDGCTPECAGKMVGEADGCDGVCSGSGMGIGLKPGGAQDAAYFKKLVAEGQVPEPKYLPIEGWLNEHDTPLPPPEFDRVITLHGFVGLFHDPSYDEPLLALQMGLNSGLSPQAIELAELNLAVVIDKSGSMADEGKIEFVKQGLTLMVDQLDANDRLAIVVYDTTATVLRPSAKVTDKGALKELIAGITADGTTNLHGGMMLGFQEAEKAMDAAPDAIPRVMLLSDGLANEGEVTDNEGIVAAAKPHIQKGIGLTTIGVGAGFNFELMYALANLGNGNFYFIDAADRLLDVFVEEVRYLLTPVAENLRIWFTLPQGFTTTDIYGFEFTDVDGATTLLGPAEQYSVTPDDGTGDPGGGGQGGVAVSTVFASKKNGIVFAKIRAPGLDALTALEALDFAVIHYSYDLVAGGTTETFDGAVPMGAFTWHDDQVGFQFFSDDIVERNLCVLQMGLALRHACEVFHDPAAGDLPGGGGLESARLRLSVVEDTCGGTLAHLQALEWSATYLDEVRDDLDVLKQLRANLAP
jgi:hypothetical protein